MKDVGYAVVRDGEKFCGICPLGFNAAKNTRDRYAKANPAGRFEIVPLFIGAPISAVVLPPITLSKGDATN